MHCTRNLQIRYDLLACNLQVALISKIDYSLLAKRLKTEWVQTTVRHFGQNKENTFSVTSSVCLFSSRSWATTNHNVRIIHQIKPQLSTNWRARNQQQQQEKYTENSGVAAICRNRQTSFQIYCVILFPQFHDYNLKLDGEGGWEYTMIKQE